MQDEKQAETILNICARSRITDLAIGACCCFLMESWQCHLLNMQPGWNWLWSLDVLRHTDSMLLQLFHCKHFSKHTDDLFHWDHCTHHPLWCIYCNMGSGGLLRRLEDRDLLSYELWHSLDSLIPTLEMTNKSGIHDRPDYSSMLLHLPVPK